ncbi:MAG: BtaA family protein [Pirellulaceae bacterium]|jgi:S-adenosylmethionine-diacylglycerol 3-amino-3-carboxypropyl transferase|nr:BtaA family protein [Pirellulaceae bacterium]MDP7017363.1 BtaA family protein [Pirellulaceae bacterium]
MITDWFSRRVFNIVHGNNLVYNTCWEDPRLDRVALDLGPDDNLLVITSAGCNALDYALTGINHVYAVDMNPRQNALLELKVAGIRNLEFDDFFGMFGDGRFPGVRDLYEEKLRDNLTPWSRRFWDRRIRFFDNRRKQFYFRGTSGAFARMVLLYTRRVAKLAPQVDALLSADSLDEQRDIYLNEVRERLWSRTMRFAMGRDTTLSMVGVPKAQRRQVETQYDGGIVKFVQDCVDAVFGELSLVDNYFWRVYMTGSYTRECCPEYLKEENFRRLKDGLVDRLSVHTNSVQGFLENHDGEISRYVLLDHMDWLSDRFFPLLESEWQAITDRRADRTRIIWRSGGLRTDFIDRVQVRVKGKSTHIRDMLSYHKELSDELHVKDRVHTYGSFYIADYAA